VTFVTQLLISGARSAAVELGKAAAVGAVSYAGYKMFRRSQDREKYAMGMEQQKVLEMVASGKITPEEGVRLLNALTASAQPKKRALVDLPEIKVPRIDLGPLADVGVELKNTVVSGAQVARRALKDSRAGQYLDVKKFEVSGPEAAGIARATLDLECSAGKLTLIGGETGGKLVSGKIVRVNQEPTVETEVAGDTAKFRLSHSLGKAALIASPQPEYDVKLENAASDSRLDLSELKVNSFSLENNAGSVAVKLGGSQWLLQANVQNNAGSVRLAVPTTHALKVVGSASLSSSNIEQLGLKQVGAAQQSSDWDTNEKRCEIVLVQNVASFELVWRKQKVDGVVEVMQQQEVPVAGPESNGSIPSSEL
jgi:hypothetical protein